MELTSYLMHVGSVARTSTLLGAGLSERVIGTAIAAGEISRIRHGVVALPVAAPDMVAAVLGNGLRTCASATAHHRIWRLHEPSRVHLLCRHGAAKAAVIHRGSVVPPD